MTILRRVESFGRSHRQLWRKCGQRYQSAINVPSLSSFFPSSPVIHVHTVQSFSTFSSTTRDEVTSAAEEAEMPLEVEALQLAASQAQQARSIHTLVNDPNDVIEAAAAMKTITSNTICLKVAISDPTADATHVKTLHQALIDVTSRCLSLLSRPESSTPSCVSREVHADTLLRDALYLARRAHDLELPLHLPLYQSLCTALVLHRFHKCGNELVDAILEIANMAVSSLHTTLKCSFFAHALVHLIHDGYFASAMVLIRTMATRFDIFALDIATSARAMNAIHVEHARTKHNAESAQDLLTMLQRDLEFEQRQTDETWQAFRQQIGEALDAYDEANDYDDNDDSEEEEDENSVSEYNDSDDDNEQKKPDSVLVTNKPNVDTYNFSKALMGNIETKAQKGVALVQVQVNAETGEVEGFNVSSSSVPKDENQDNEELDSFAKDMVYMRDASSWMLPDVTLQLTKLNGDHDVLYTRQYEEQILQQIKNQSWR